MKTLRHLCKAEASIIHIDRISNIYRPSPPTFLLVLAEVPTIAGMNVKPKVGPANKQKALSGSQWGSRPWIVLGAAVAGLIVAGVHWPVLSAQALSFDDSIYLFENSSFRQ